VRAQEDPSLYMQVSEPAAVIPVYSQTPLTRSFSRMMNNFKEVFEHAGDYCRFPKFHATLHYTQFIERFGSARFLDSGVGERQHKVFP
jgi:hypothetical protein